MPSTFENRSDLIRQDPAIDVLLAAKAIDHHQRFGGQLTQRRQRSRAKLLRQRQAHIFR